MSVTATFATVCDACGGVASVEVQQCDMLVELPERRGVLGMDLCDNCHLKAQHAVRQALGLENQQARRTLN